MARRSKPRNDFRHTARAGALLGYPDARCARICPRCAKSCAANPSCSTTRQAELDALIESLRSRRTAGSGGRLRRTVRPRPRHLAAPVRARARRLARPRSGDDRPRANLRKSRPVPGAGRVARLSAGRARVRVHPAAARSDGVSRRNGAHFQRPSSARCASATSPYASVLGALLELAGEKAQAGRAGGRTCARRKLGRAAGVRRLLDQGPGEARPAATHSHRPQDASPSKERAHERILVLSAHFPVRLLPVHLHGGVSRRQPRSASTAISTRGKAIRRRCCAPARCAGAAISSTSASCFCSSGTSWGC